VKFQEIAKLSSPSRGGKNDKKNKNLPKREAGSH
jgi:hypothetical protein